jgi:MFS family permease
MRQRRSMSADRLPDEVYILAAMAVIAALGFGILAPAIPLLAEEFGEGKVIAALAFSCFALARFCSAFAYGRLVGVLGERTIVVLGLVIQSVAMTAAAFAPSFEFVIAMRTISGLGSAAFTVSSMTMLLRLVPSHKRGRAVGLYQGGFLMGAIGGPAVGGFLTDVSVRLPFVIYGVLAMISAGVGLSRLPARANQSPSHPDSMGADALGTYTSGADDDLHVDDALRAEEGGLARRGGRRGAPVRSPLRSRAFLAALLLTVATGWSLYGTRASLGPVYVSEQLGHSAAWTGGAFLALSLTQVIVLWRAARLSDSWGRRPTMIIGSMLATVALAILVLPPHSAAFIASMMLLGAAAGFSSSSPAAVVGDLTGKSGGKGIALFSMSGDFGSMAGPLVSGYLTEAHSYNVAFTVCAGTFAIAAVACLAMPETRPRTDVRPAGAAR